MPKLSVRAKVAFEDVSLSPVQYRVFALLLDGKSINEIVRLTGKNEIYIQRAVLPKMLAVLKSALSAELTAYHLFAREFMRLQDDILRPQVMESIEAAVWPGCGLTDAQVDAKLAEFAEQDRLRVMSAGA